MAFFTDSTNPIHQAIRKIELFTDGLLSELHPIRNLTNITDGAFITSAILEIILAEYADLISTFS